MTKRISISYVSVALLSRGRIFLILVVDLLSEMKKQSMSSHNGMFWHKRVEFIKHPNNLYCLYFQTFAFKVQVNQHICIMPFLKQSIGLVYVTTVFVIVSSQEYFFLSVEQLMEGRTL